MKLPPCGLKRREGTEGTSEEEREGWEPTTCEDSRTTLYGGRCIDNSVLNFIMSLVKFKYSSRFVHP